MYVYDLPRVLPNTYIRCDNGETVTASDFLTLVKLYFPGWDLEAVKELCVIDYFLNERSVHYEKMLPVWEEWIHKYSCLRVKRDGTAFNPHDEEMARATRI